MLGRIGKFVVEKNGEEIQSDLRRLRNLETDRFFGFNTTSSDGFLLTILKLVDAIKWSNISFVQDHTTDEWSYGSSGLHGRPRRLNEGVSWAMGYKSR